MKDSEIRHSSNPKKIDIFYPCRVNAGVNYFRGNYCSRSPSSYDFFMNNFKPYSDFVSAPRIPQRIEDGLSSMEYMPEPLPGDKWLLSSAFQKSLRTGCTETALRAAVAFWEIDRQAFWRRLHVTAMEDIGIGHLETVLMVLVATASTSWRRKAGDLRVGLFLTMALCGSIKSRMADELFIHAEKSPALKQQRLVLSAPNDDDLRDMVLRDENDLVSRALAVWYLAGTHKYPSDFLPPRMGKPDQAHKVLRGTNLPYHLIEACLAVMGRTSWPLCLFLPLMWQETMKDDDLKVITENLPTMRHVQGIPLSAADLFTRIGQGCYRKFQKSVPALKGFGPKQIGHAVFYEEGAKLDRYVTSPKWDQFRQDAEIYDMEATGLCAPECLALRSLVAEHFEVLQDIRIQELTSYLSKGIE